MTAADAKTLAAKRVSPWVQIAPTSRRTRGGEEDHGREVDVSMRGLRCPESPPAVAKSPCRLSGTRTFVRSLPLNRKPRFGITTSYFFGTT